MTSLTAPIQVGIESGGRETPRGIAALDSFVEFMQFCMTCECEQIFRAGWHCEFGLVGCCLGCGDERIAPFSRTTSEVA